MAEAGTVVVPVIPSVSAFLPTLERALAPALAKLKTEFTSAGTGLSQAMTGVGLAAGAVFAGLSIKGVTAFQDIAGEVRTLETQLGTTAEQASILRAQADAVGVSTTQLSAGFSTLGKKIVANDDVLAQYGVEVARTADGQVDFGATLLSISDIFQAMPPGVDRTAAAMALFGRSGKALLPLLSANSDELASFAANAEAAGLIMSEQDVQASRDFAIAQRELGAAFEGIAVSLGRALVPLLTRLAEILRVALDIVGPFLPQIRNLFVAFLAYKALTFIPALFEDMVTNLEELATVTGVTAAAQTAASTAVATTGAAAATGAVQLRLFSEAELAAGTAGGAAAAGGLSALLSKLGQVLPLLLRFAPGLIGIGGIQVPSMDTRGVTDAIATMGKLHTQLGSTQQDWEDLTARIEKGTGVQDLNVQAVKVATLQMIPYAEALHTVAEAARDAAAAQTEFNRVDTAQAVESTRQVLHSFGTDIESLGTLTGTSSRDVAANITGMVRDVKGALHKDDAVAAAKAWAHGIAAQLATAKEAFRTMAAGIAEQLGFVSGAFSTFVGDSSVSLHEFEGKLDHALTAQKRFTSDLTTLLDSGGKGFAILGQQFLDAGAAGATRLHQLVNAPKEVQAAFARLARTSNSLATSASQVLAHKLGGTLRDIRGFFEDLTRAIEKKLDIDIDGSDIVTAKKDTDKLGQSILNLTKTPFVVTAKADTSAADNAFQSFISRWAGTQITLFGLLDIAPVDGHATGFHQTVTKPTLMLVGERGPERVDVTPSRDTGPSGPGGSGAASLRIDWRHNRGDLQGELDQLDRMAL